MISSIVFILLLIATIALFYKNVSVIVNNINLGKDLEIVDNKTERWKKMFRVAIGQSKMIRRPLSGIFHIMVYAGFILVNVEMLEIMIDGIFGTHRFLSFLPYYNVLISFFEFFALTVIIACFIFLMRRDVVRVSRFHSKEMKRWPILDANIILITEILLMTALFFMNAADRTLQLAGSEHYVDTGHILFSGFLVPALSNLPDTTLIFIDKFGWWFHIAGVFIFLNYIPYSKHFHVFLSFPNVYYSKLKPVGYLTNMESITNEVKISMSVLDEEDVADVEIERFGVKDVDDLNWKSLMDAYTCTECGRCMDVCPANITGKLLSPRKIMMDTRDRLEEVGNQLVGVNNKCDKTHNLLGYYISSEEIWACTTCNACTTECPVNIDQASIIMEMRRYISLEEGGAPGTLNAAITNIENNGAPWQFSPEDRMLWAEGLEVPLMSNSKDHEYLFWVGSAGAFDDRYKKVTRDFIKILNYLKVDYAVLGVEESDSGDIARRAGNEMLYQMQAMMNIEVLNGYEVKNIITCDPHDFNTLKNEYPDYDGNYNVVHHTQFLQQQISVGNLKINSNAFAGKKITFHDPCYLGRANGEYDAPRDVLNAIPSVKIEMKRNKSFALCCGAGGGQMFKEAEKGDKEVFMERTEEALKTGCDIIATACPFCMVMMTDGLKYANKEEEIKNMDIAELVSVGLGL